MRLSLKTRKKYLRNMGDRYVKTKSKPEKSILAEVVEVMGYHRKHAIQVLKLWEKSRDK